MLLIMDYHAAHEELIERPPDEHKYHTGISCKRAYT